MAKIRATNSSEKMQLMDELTEEYSPPEKLTVIFQYTECNRRNGPDFGSVFLRSNYTDITQNTYIQSSMVTEILAREV